MSETLDGITPPMFEVDNDGLDHSRPCNEEGCESFVPLGAHMARKYCDVHVRGKGDSTRRARTKAEKAPKLVLEVGGKAAAKGDKKNARAAETAAGAKAFMNVVATGLAMSGDDVCAGAVAQGANAWGDAVGELSKYQPWLATFFAPVGGESQLGAWLGFAMTTGAIALPVLAHHNLLPESVGAKLGGVYVAAADNDARSQPVAS